MIDTDKPLITGRLLAAARALTGVSVADLAAASGIPVATVSMMENDGRAEINSMLGAEAVVRALERFGAVFVAEDDDLGAGVRLNFTRQDVRQISRLEGEGGPAPEDDVL